MDAREVTAVLAMLLVAGCAGPTDPPGGGDPGGPLRSDLAEPSFFRTAACTNALLFQLVDYANTDPYLPPGFHPRDPQQFLGTPVAFGQAGVIFLVLSCPGQPEPWEVGLVAIFVEPPIVTGLPVARFDFYEVVRYGTDAFDAVLAPAAWPRVPASVHNNFTVGLTGNTAFGEASVADELGLVASMGGFPSSPVSLGDALVRFWHDGPAGLAYQEFQANLETRVGPGYCSARSGSPLAGFAVDEGPLPVVPPVLGLQVLCPPGEPVVAVFVGVDMPGQQTPWILNATARFLPEVHAE